MVNEPQRCPVCPRIRRGDRPLCNNHMRRVGQQALDRWFARRGHVDASDDLHTPSGIVAQRNLADAEQALVDQALEYDRIRARGVRPRWIPDRETWADPRQYARGALAAWIARHQFGLDRHNDAAVLDQIVADLFPTETRTRK